MANAKNSGKKRGNVNILKATNRKSQIPIASKARQSEFGICFLLNFGRELQVLVGFDCAQPDIVINQMLLSLP